MLFPVIRISFDNFRFKFDENRSSGFKVVVELRIQDGDYSRWGVCRLGFGLNTISGGTGDTRQPLFQV